jgi:hypothetical protein
MRSFLLYFVLIALCLPPFGGGASSLEIKMDESMVTVTKSTGTVAGQHPHHLSNTEDHQSYSHSSIRNNQVDDTHECCDDDNTTSSILCCEEGCNNCSSDCSSGGFALLTADNALTVMPSATLLSSTTVLPVSPYQTKIIPPIS